VTVLTNCRIPLRYTTSAR